MSKSGPSNHQPKRRRGSAPDSAPDGAGVVDESSPIAAVDSPNTRTITVDSRMVWVVLSLLVLFGLGFVLARGGFSLPAVAEPDKSSNLWVFFLIGLTAGGLSCLAVQGGLLAATIAQSEQRRLEAEATAGMPLTPVLLFLAAKLAAYTALGALLGLFGSLFALTPTLRGILQIAIGLFMIGLALGMLNVHPLFRYFMLQPPKWAQRAVRKQSRRGDALAPLLLGAMTVLIPCAVTQAMELLVISIGNPTRGAAIMFAFILGTTPVFLILGVLATSLSQVWQRAFMRVAAVIIVIIAVFSMITGLRLMGLGPVRAGPAVQAEVVNGTTSGPAPATSTGASLGSTSSAGVPASAPAAGQAGEGTYQEATINVGNGGYEPNHLQVKAGTPIHLKLVTNNTRSCARAFTIPSLNVQQVLQPTDEQVVNLPPQPPGEIPFSCSMGMYTGVIEVVQ
jgi:uncharacterized protein